MKMSVDQAHLTDTTWQVNFQMNSQGYLHAASVVYVNINTHVTAIRRFALSESIKCIFEKFKTTKTKNKKIVW